MWRCLLIGCALAGTSLAQSGPSPIEFANLREDVRGLTQRLGDLSLRVEQLERENMALRTRAASANASYATVQQLNEAIDNLNLTIKSAVATSKNETLQQVATQMEKLAKQTNAALDSLARAQAARPAAVSTAAPAPAAAAVASEPGAKDGSTYTVQKGDTLARIAKKTGAREQDIITANKLTDPSHIVVGQNLLIPTPPSSAAK